MVAYGINYLKRERRAKCARREFKRANLPSSPYSHFPLALFFFEPSTLESIDFKKALSTLTKHVRLILCQVTALGKAKAVV